MNIDITLAEASEVLRRDCEKVRQRYDNVYERFTRDVFYPREKDWQKANVSLFGKPDWKGFLKREFGIDLTL